MNNGEMNADRWSRQAARSYDLALVTVSALALLVPIRSPAADILVASNTDAALRNAISLADPGDTIVFAPGLSGNVITLTNGELTIAKALTIDASNLPGGLTISGGDMSRVFVIDTDDAVVIDSLGITNGKAPDGASGAEGEDGGNGGGLLINRGDVTLRNSTVSGNSAGDGGSSYTSVFGGEGGNGGGIYVLSGTLALDKSTISGNSAGRGGSSTDSGGDGGSGGGIFQMAGTMRISITTIEGNSAGNGGSGGPNGGRGGDGGGIASFGFFTLTWSNIKMNQSGNGIDDHPGGNGGGLFLGSSNGTVARNTSFTANSTGSGDESGDGGAIYVEGSLLLQNSTVSGNSTAPAPLGDAGSGGGIFMNAGTLRVDQTTIVDNSTGEGGGGLFLSFGNVFLANSIVANNQDELSGADISLLSATLNRDGFNLIGGNESVEEIFPDPIAPGAPNLNGDLVGTPELPLDPLLLEQAAPVETAFGSIILNFLTPQPGSPAIDAGDDAQIPTDGGDIDDDDDISEKIPLDQRGLDRISGAAVDLGSVEDQAGNPATADNQTAALETKLRKQLGKLKKKIKAAKRSGKKAKLKKLKKKFKKLKKRLKQL